MWAIETQQLCKAYGRRQSLIDCDLQVATGTVFGLLGPNGAGKTTLLRTLLGFLKPTSGTARIGSFSIQTELLQARQQVAYLPGDARLMRSMRGLDLLRLFSGLHPHGSLSDSIAVAKRLELELSRRVLFMSTGMRQKLALAIVLGCQAPVVVLDEPTANLDPNVRGEVIELVREIQQQGRTVLLSSHIFSDIDDVCQRVAILRAGRMVAEQDMSQLQQMHIVTGRLRDAEHAATVRALLADHRLVSFCEIRCFCETRSVTNPISLEVHLSGSPQHWLNLLASAAIESMQIERAGIRSVYQRHHRSPDASQVETA